MSESDVDAERTYDADEYDPNPGERGKWISAIIALLGLWMIVEALWLDLVPGQFWNDVVVGALLLVVGGYNYSRRANEQLGSAAAAVVAALVGLWLVVAPFVLGGGEVGLSTNEVGFWNDIVVGLVVLALGAYSAYEIRDRRREAVRPVT